MPELPEVEALAEGMLGIGGPPEVEDLLAALRSSRGDDLEAEYQSLFGGTVAVMDLFTAQAPGPLEPHLVDR